MSSHAAFRPDSDLLTRAADGDGAAALALLARHGAPLWQQARDATGDPDEASAAVAITFAALLTGLARPAAGSDASWLRALVASHAPATIRDSSPVPQRAITHENLVAALAERLPAPQRAALLAAQQSDTAFAVPPSAAPEVAYRPPSPAIPAATEVSLAALEELHRAILADSGAARQADPARNAPATRARSLDRYIERPTPLRWIAPLALVASLIALWSWWQLSARVGLDPFFPAPRPSASAAPGVPTSAWPTLPPRTTRVVAQQEPQPTAISAPPATATTPPTATVTVPPTATATAPRPPTAAPLAPTATVAPPRPTATATATRPAPVAPPPTATRALPTPAPPTATATATVPPPTPTATKVTANPPWLALATQNLAFGVEVGPRTLTFTNSGGEPLNWRVVADSTWVELGSSSGTILPGGTQSVPVTIARGDLPTGGYNGVLQLVTDGGEGLVPVTMAVSPSNTTISAFTEPTTPIGALGCAEPTTHTVSAAIGGDAPPRKAALYFAMNGGTQRTIDLTVESAGRYRAVLGPFTETGAILYSLVITEADGTVVRSASYSLQVTGCPTQVQTVPVVPPVTQPFALNGGGHTIYTFAVTQPGTLNVTLRWKGGAQRLSTLLYGPRRTDQPYEQRTGVGTLAWEFPVTAEDVAAGGTWALHLVNYEVGEANGTFELIFTPLGQSRPTPSVAPPTPTVPAPTPAPSPTPAITPTRSAPAPTTRPATPGTPRTP